MDAEIREYYYTCEVADKNLMVAVFDLLGIEVVDACEGKYYIEYVVKAKNGFQHSLKEIANIVKNYRI